jgi:hypothetical protein
MHFHTVVAYNCHWVSNVLCDSYKSNETGRIRDTMEMWRVHTVQLASWQCGLNSGNTVEDLILQCEMP